MRFHHTHMPRANRPSPWACISRLWLTLTRFLLTSTICPLRCFLKHLLGSSEPITRLPHPRHATHGRKRLKWLHTAINRESSYKHVFFGGFLGCSSFTPKNRISRPKIVVHDSFTVVHGCFTVPMSKKSISFLSILPRHLTQVANGTVTSWFMPMAEHFSCQYVFWHCV